jgi:hypothetical protein
MSLMLTARGTLLAVAVVALVGGGATRVVAQLDPETNTHGFDPVAESYEMAEARRMDQIARQLDLNYRMQISAGFGPRYPAPFEPWPRVPGDIWGYPQSKPITQPLGHESLQTGPNRWMYRPIYPGPQPLPAPVKPQVTAPATPRAQVKAPVQAELPAPSDAAPADRVPRPAPKKQPPLGPRAF